MIKSIVEKLNLKKYKRAVVLNQPEGSDYLEGLKDYETELSEEPYDLIFAFVLDMNALKQVVNKVVTNHYLNTNGYLYLAYPKKGNKVYGTFIYRDELLEGLGTDKEGYLERSSIKFAKMVGLDDVFTVVGLKEEARDKKSVSKKMSQSVDDYIQRIPDVEKDLQNNPDLLAFYRSLTPGYQKDWARYIYSAKQEATKLKRREEMKMILASGYKSRDLYRNR